MHWWNDRIFYEYSIDQNFNQRMHWSSPCSWSWLQRAGQSAQSRSWIFAVLRRAKGGAGIRKKQWGIKNYQLSRIQKYWEYMFQIVSIFYTDAWWKCRESPVLTHAYLGMRQHFGFGSNPWFFDRWINQSQGQPVVTCLDQYLPLLLPPISIKSVEWIIVFDQHSFMISFEIPNSFGRVTPNVKPPSRG